MCGKKSYLEHNKSFSTVVKGKKKEEFTGIQELLFSVGAI